MRTSAARWPYLSLVCACLRAWRVDAGRHEELEALLGPAPRSSLNAVRLLPFCLRPGDPYADLPPWVGAREAQMMALGEAQAIRDFVLEGPPSQRRLRLDLAERFCAVTDALPCDHHAADFLQFARAVLALPTGVPGCLIEAGTFMGGGAAKLSLLARACGRRLEVFDTFRGFPRPLRDRSVTGRPVRVPTGMFAASRDEVRRNIRRLGAPGACRLHEGPIEASPGGDRQPVAAAYIDVCLASAHRACARLFYPRLSPGGLWYVHDAFLRKVAAIYRDRRFWRSEVGQGPPRAPGLGRGKHLLLSKP